MNKHYAELVLIWSLPKFIKGNGDDRLQNLFYTLQKETVKDMETIKETTSKEHSETINILGMFIHKIGWYNNRKYIMTFLSFLLAMIENSKSIFNPKIKGELNKIVKYFENKKQTKVQYFWEGDIITEKFNEIFE